MAVVRIDLEVADKGSGQVINNVGGQLKMLGSEGIKAGAAIGTGFTLAQKAIELTIGVIQSAVGGIAGFISSSVQGFVALGGHLTDMAAKTGISTQALQKLAYAGSLVGVSEEQITAAAVKMERALANGDAVFGKLGLSVQKLRAMKPDEAFAAIAAQIAKIKDPAGQAAAAMEAFGKSGASMLPLMKSDLKAVMEEAERLGIVLSEKDVKGADNLGDAVTKLGAVWSALQNQFAAAIVTNPALVEGLEKVVKVIGEMVQWVIKNQGAIALWVKSGITEAVVWLKFLAEWAGKAGKALLGMAEMIAPGLQKAMREANLTAEAVRLAKAALAPKGGPGGGPDFSGGKGGAAAAAAEARKQESIQKMLYDSRIRALREIDKQVEAEYKSNVTKVGQLLDQWAEGERMTAAAIKKSRDDMADAMNEYAAKVEATTVAAHEKHMQQLDDIQSLGDAIRNLGDTLGSGFLSSIGDAIGGWAAFAKGAENATTKIQKVTLAIDAAASAYNSGFQSKSTGKGALQGAAKGAGAGSAFAGPWGVAIGAIAGAAIGFFGAKKGQQAEIKALTAEFDGLVAQAKRAGIELTKAFDTKSAKGLKQAIIDLNKILDDTAEAQAAVADAAERYGFTIEELGPAMAQQQLDAQMAQIYKDWQLLTAAGVDHEAMLTRIGPSVGILVDQYKAAGVEIPSAMKPIIDDLYQHGKLIHENGDAYTEAEYAGLTYAQTMSQMFEELIAKVTDLVNALLGIPNVNRTVTVNTVRTGGGGGEGGEGGNAGDPGENGGRNHGFASGLLLTSASQNGVARYHRGERVEITPAANSGARNRSNGSFGVGALAAEIRGLADSMRASDRAFIESQRARDLAMPAMLKSAVALGKA